MAAGAAAAGSTHTLAAVVAQADIEPMWQERHSLRPLECRMQSSLVLAVPDRRLVIEELQGNLRSSHPFPVPEEEAEEQVRQQALALVPVEDQEAEEGSRDRAAEEALETLHRYPLRREPTAERPMG